MIQKVCNVVEVQMQKMGTKKVGKKKKRSKNLNDLTTNRSINPMQAGAPTQPFDYGTQIPLSDAHLNDKTQLCGCARLLSPTDGHLVVSQLCGCARLLSPTDGHLVVLRIKHLGTLIVVYQKQRNLLIKTKISVQLFSRRIAGRQGGRRSHRCYGWACRLTLP